MFDSQGAVVGVSASEGCLPPGEICVASVGFNHAKEFKQNVDRLLSTGRCVSFRRHAGQVRVSPCERASGLRCPAGGALGTHVVRAFLFVDMMAKFLGFASCEVRAVCGCSVLFCVREALPTSAAGGSDTCSLGVEPTHGHQEAALPTATAGPGNAALPTATAGVERPGVHCGVHTGHRRFFRLHPGRFVRASDRVFTAGCIPGTDAFVRLHPGRLVRRTSSDRVFTAGCIPGTDGCVRLHPGRFVVRAFLFFDMMAKFLGFSACEVRAVCWSSVPFECERLCPPLLRAARARVPSAFSRHTVQEAALPTATAGPGNAALPTATAGVERPGVHCWVHTGHRWCFRLHPGLFVSYERATGCSLLGAYRAPTRFVYIQGGS
jgi:hypothetical protein